MGRFICIHGHFYQPPRENAWLESVEAQDSAHPYHDWNERITAECYGPNAFARILDAEGRIARIVNNYARISFDFGPTLLSWLEVKAPAIYAAVIDADRQSQTRFSGHGSAMAQVYNHMILPLANRRDKITQVRWGIDDFERRFGRKPEGMWLPETAVDLESLEILAEHGIRFTILAPQQAVAVRPLGDSSWQDVSSGKIDSTRAYRQQLPSGATIDLFFFDSQIARGVAFERLLNRGEEFAQRLLGAVSDKPGQPQLIHIATDGENYGHHHTHGDMSLAFALHQIEANPQVRLTNYGEFLEKHPPAMEVQIAENTSWSCPHGVERWRRHCGCNSGRFGWNQTWREPLRRAMDDLRDRIQPLYEQAAAELVKDPWQARDDYHQVILDRSPETIETFLLDHAGQELAEEQRIRLFKLLEMQRHAMLMYTSCGWFFDEISGIETVQVMEYAGRAIQLADELFNGSAPSVGAPFLEELEKARSNVRRRESGRQVFERFVTPAMVDWRKICAHYAISSLFETYPEEARIYCFATESQDAQAHEAGKAKLVVGRVRLTSLITSESEVLMYSALYFGDHNINGGVRRFDDDKDYQTLTRDLATAFARGDFAEIIRLMDRGFGESTYSLRSLFRDEQRRITKRLLQPTVAEAEAVYRRLYEQHMPTMRFLAELNVPLPRAFQAAIEFVITSDLRRAYQHEDPDLSRIGELLSEAARWEVALDTSELAYRLKKTMDRLAERFRRQPSDMALLESYDAALELVRSLPFEVDLWQPQNNYFEMQQTVCPEIEAKARHGDSQARDWLQQFIALGERLGIQVAEPRKKLEDFQKVPTVTDVVRQAIEQQRVPLASYRMQFTPTFTFGQAREQVEYLVALGITDLYASPILCPRPGSQHCYDICDHSRINPELGGEVEFDRLAEALHPHGMGLILDTVPNHMGIGHHCNLWWMDVLENGPASVHASFFDIDWDPVNPDLKNKVLLPVLEDQYGAVLEQGKIRLRFEDGAFFLYHYESRLPVEPKSYLMILEDTSESLKESLGADNEHVQELHSILTALNYLPTHTETAAEKVQERNREKEVIKRRLANLAETCAEFRACVEKTAREVNGNVADRASFDRLDRLLEVQPYRLAFWRVATEEINYRRFFDINDLAAIRVEVPEVFQATHQLIFKLLGDGKATALRIDHPDGLWDPTEYFHKLQVGYLAERVRVRLGAAGVPENLETEVAAVLNVERSEDAANATWPLYVVAEKILGEKEPLPADWAVFGTTGYDFLNTVNGIFVNRANRETFDTIYRQFIRRAISFADLTVQCQKTIMAVSMASEITALGHQLDRISERNRRYRDFTLSSLTLAIRGIIAALPIYRTYINGRDVPSPGDRRFIEQAVEHAKTADPGTAEAVFDFIRDTLLLRNLQDFAEADRPALLAWTMKFQQVTGPVLAKGLEDTAFYIYNRLVSLNEVGGNPEAFGNSVEDFHHQNQLRVQNWPHTMLATATHDTKRGEDMRARLNVLSELPAEWEAAVSRWSRLNEAKKTILHGRPAPDRNDEYLLYQSLVGAWAPGPVTPESLASFRGRVADYMQKAINEAKVHTGWVNPNREYDEAMKNFVERLVTDQPDDPFLAEVAVFQQRLAFFGYFNSLSQVLLKLASPGVPDFYQGTELWDFSLVDPDNRRPVDYQHRRQVLNDLRQRAQAAPAEMLSLAQELLGAIADGRIKLFVIMQGLSFRNANPSLFRNGSYEPLQVSGEKSAHLCAFARRHESKETIVVAPRLLAGLVGDAATPPLGPNVWGDTVIELPGREGRNYRNHFTGEVVPVVSRDGEPGIKASEVLKSFPVALLESQGGS